MGPMRSKRVPQKRLPQTAAHIGSDGSSKIGNSIVCYGNFIFLIFLNFLWYFWGLYFPKWLINELINHGIELIKQYSK